MRRFLTDLLMASEKAAQIARACRKEKDLFQLLIEEKSGSDKNGKFAHDFKTLADVLIQETVRHDLGQQYPTLAENILGEETNKFTNTLGETINVKIKDTEKETSELLHQVLDQDTKAADLLAKQVHSVSVVIPDLILNDLEQVPEGWESLRIEDLGIWIDPIDSTNNYIRGNKKSEEFEIQGDLEMTNCGLQVVTVLIGVFDRKSGHPVAGVVNQPFARYDRKTETWKGQIYWGLNMVSENRSFFSISLKTFSDLNRTKKRVVFGSNELEEFTERLYEKFELLKAAGAGYKIICVALNFVDFYITKKASTYKWDSCAGHAILNAIGGGCLEYKKFTQNDTWCDIQYHEPRPGTSGPAQWSNSEGILACRNRNDLQMLKEILN